MVLIKTDCTMDGNYQQHIWGSMTHYEGLELLLSAAVFLQPMDGQPLFQMSSCFDIVLILTYFRMKPVCHKVGISQVSNNG